VATVTVTLPTGVIWPCCETIETPPAVSESGEFVAPEDYLGCLLNYGANSSPPWSEDPIDSIEDIFISDYSPCSSDNLTESLSFSGSTSCDTFAAIRECEAKYLIETCGAAQEYGWIAGDSTERGFYVKCSRDDQINCWPISHWKCPDCPECQVNDVNFLGCITNTDTNKKKLGSKQCSFIGSLDGSTPCSNFDSLKQCLLQECEQKCGVGSCIENNTGFYLLCDDNGTTSCRPQAQ
jgi:hypothetical protein